MIPRSEVLCGDKSVGKERVRRNRDLGRGREAPSRDIPGRSLPRIQAHGSGESMEASLRHYRGRDGTPKARCAWRRPLGRFLHQILWRGVTREAADRVCADVSSAAWPVRKGQLRFCTFSSRFASSRARSERSGWVSFAAKRSKYSRLLPRVLPLKWMYPRSKSTSGSTSLSD